MLSCTVETFLGAPRKPIKLKKLSVKKDKNSVIMSDKPEGSSVKRPNLFIKNPQQHSHDTHFSIQKTSPRLNNGGGLLVKR